MNTLFMETQKGYAIVGRSGGTKNRPLRSYAHRVDITIRIEILSKILMITRFIVIDVMI